MSDDPGAGEDDAGAPGEVPDSEDPNEGEQYHLEVSPGARSPR